MALFVFWFSWAVAVLTVAGAYFRSQGKCRFYAKFVSLVDEKLLSLMVFAGSIFSQAPHISFTLKKSCSHFLGVLLFKVAKTFSSFERKLKNLSLKLSHRPEAKERKSKFLNTIQAHKKSLREAGNN